MIKIITFFTLILIKQTVYGGLEEPTIEIKPGENKSKIIIQTLDYKESTNLLEITLFRTNAEKKELENKNESLMKEIETLKNKQHKIEEKINEIKNEISNIEKGLLVENNQLREKIKEKNKEETPFPYKINNP